MTNICSGWPMRLVAALCVLFLLFAPALPSTLPVEDGPATRAQTAPDIDKGRTAQPLVIAPASVEGEADALTPPHPPVSPTEQIGCANAAHATPPPYTRPIAFRARAPPAPV